MNETLARPLRRFRDRLVVPVEQRLSRIAARVDELSGLTGDLARGLEAIGATVENLGRRVDELSERFTASTERLDARAAVGEARAAERDARIAAQAEASSRLARQLEVASDAVTDHSARLRDLEAQSTHWALRDSLLAVEALALGRLESPRAEPGTSPLVSVVMATHQRAGMVGEAITSVLGQTHTNWELLISDSGPSISARCARPTTSI